MKRMSKSELDAWYAGQKPFPHAAKKRQYARAVIDADRLVLGLWQGREPVGIYVIRPNGAVASHRSKPCESWGATNIAGMFGHEFDYYTYEPERDLDILTTDADKAVIESFINGQLEYKIYQLDWWRMLGTAHRRYISECRETYKRNRDRKIAEYGDALPDPPEGFDEWLHGQVFGGLNYAFGEKGSRVYACTACGLHHEADWKDRHRTICPETGREIVVTKRAMTTSAEEPTAYISRTVDGEAVAMFGTGWMIWERAGAAGRCGFDAEFAVILPKGKRGASRWLYRYTDCWGCGTTWSDKNRGNYRHRAGYMFPVGADELLAGTVYEHLGIGTAARKGWKVNYNRLMMAYWVPQTEYLIKGGFERLVYDVSLNCNSDYYPIKFSEGKDAAGCLGISPQRVTRLRQINGGIRTYRWLRWEEETDEKIGERELAWVSDRIDPSNMEEMLCMMATNRAIHYLQRLLDAGYRDVYTVVNTWKDYINMCRRLKMDVTKEAVYKPRDLKARHDELAQIIAEREDRLRAEENEARFPEVAGVCADIKGLYEWGDGTHEVRVPGGVNDIMREGRLLRHCVGSSDRYFERIADRESFILFLRKSAEPEAPWYTMEVEPGGKIRQLRTIGDNEGDDRKEAKDFLRLWCEQVQKRLTAEQRQAAEISRQKRLAEFAELRAGGNVVRNGRLAGQLLADVLEADFAELNFDKIEEMVG